jgi:hypothetical protein
MQEGQAIAQWRDTTNDRGDSPNGVASVRPVIRTILIDMREIYLQIAFRPIASALVDAVTCACNGLRRGGSVFVVSIDREDAAMRLQSGMVSRGG